MTRRGFVFILTLAVIIFVSLAGSTLLVGGVTRSNIGLRTQSRSSALHLAEAAAHQAALNLRTADAGDDTLTGALYSGDFTINSVTALGNDLTRVLASGTSQFETRQVEVVYRLVGESIFQFALFGDQLVSVSGSAITDSYDSCAGLYENDPDDPDYNAGHNGDVGTNSTAAGGITVGGSIFVDGQLAVGMDVDDPESLVTGYDPAFITGGTSPPSDTQDVVAQPTAFPMPAVEVPAGLTCSALTVGGNTTTTLPAGGGAACVGNECCFTTLTVQGGGELTASTDVKVYMTDELTATGNTVVGVPSDPTRMLFLIASTGEATIEGTITGSSQFYGALYAPDAAITITGNADVFGSIIAEQINVTGSAAIHYDECLTACDVPDPPPSCDISNTYETTTVSWREIQL